LKSGLPFRRDQAALLLYRLRSSSLIIYPALLFSIRLPSAHVLTLWPCSIEEYHESST